MQMHVSRTALVALLALVALGLAGGVLAFALDDDEPAAAGAATAPIAPPGVTLLPSCATDVPTQGREQTEDRTVALPSPAPDAYRPTTAERALAEFMDAWRDRAFDRMALWTTPSWRELTPDHADQGRLMRERYGNARLLGWTILREERGSGPAVRRFRVLAAYRDVAPQVQRERLLFVLNRENAEGRLVRAGGRWGVFLTAETDAAPGSGVPVDGCTTADPEDRP